jgi:trimeric autotransporter adhesin
MRASGGYRLFSNTNATSGVFLASGGGSWISMSDRNAKEDLQPVTSLEVLNKVAALPVATWKYKSQDPGVRHIGPMAQDFKAAFGVGETETGITTVDADGVALAAIQGLNQKVEAQRAENAELKQEVAELKRLLNQLSAKVNGGVK